MVLMRISPSTRLETAMPVLASSWVFMSYLDGKG
jgi:hypothetical protein